METQSGKPRQISKPLSILLLNEEVEVWQALHDYAVKKKMAIWSRPNRPTVSNTRLMREILRMAAERLAQETGDESLASKLAQPREYPPLGPQYRRARPVVSKKSTKRKPKTVVDPRPTHRIYWNRPWRTRSGGQ